MSSLPSQPLPRRQRLVASLLLLGLSLPAAPALAGPGGGRLTPEQAAKVFPESRSLMLKDRRARIAILERGERCISAAENGDGLRRCLKDERSASMRQRRQTVDEMRRLYERNGLPVPQWRGGRSGEAGGQGGASF
jgi:hypothetical protein